MADVKCAECGVAMEDSREGWQGCKDCGVAYCPSCLARMRSKSEAEKLEAIRDDPHRRVLATCPRCTAELAQLDWV